MPNARTATIAVSRVRMTGCSLARTMSQPDVAVSAMPDAVVAPPPSRAGECERPPWSHHRLPTTSAALRSSSTCRSAAATSSARCVVTTTVRSAASAGEDRVDWSPRLRRRGARWARRAGRRARSTGCARATATRARCPADSPNPSSPSGCPAPRGSPATSPSRPTRRRASQSRSGATGSAATSRRASRSVTGQQERALGDEVAAAGAHGTGGGRPQPGRELEEGGLADPDGAGHRGEPAAGVERDAAENPVVVAGVG